MQGRIHDILAQKIAMGAGYDGGDDMMGYGYVPTAGGARRRRRRRAPVRRRRAPMRRRRARRPSLAALRRMYGGDDGGILYGGVPVAGGYKRKRRPSAWNLAVGDYVRKHPGMTVAEAAHALSGRRGYRTRRRGAGGVMVGGRRPAVESLYLSKADREIARKAQKQYEQDLFCTGPNYKRRLSHATSKAEIGRIARECGYDPIDKQRKKYLAALRGLAGPFDPTYGPGPGAQQLGRRQFRELYLPQGEYA